ncbi:deoxycytidylate deaminase-like [Chanos chanos]|uniref:Deoxycytidylate deaminase n=1 Tax=Chanos chanos TaxID=29144 RepID=A0A6J2WIJ7_CHACN|nr:deoxycytidylate deaminase-like [Chanos chanos]
MAAACLAAQRSKDPSTQVGAVIVNETDNKIVGTGYNGMPAGLDDQFPWKRDGEEPLKKKYIYVTHGELNAIMNKSSADVKGCTMYVTLFPCNECAKLIIQSGIRKVIYLSNKYEKSNETQAAKRMFDEAEVKTEQFKTTCSEILINFHECLQ